jgi:hypothetical protein
VAALFVVGTGLGAYFTACSIAMMRSVPQEDINVASGVFMMFMMMGNTLSIILSTSFVVLFGQNHLLQSAQKYGIVLSPQQQQDLVEVISKVEHSASQLTDFAPNQIQPLLSLIDEAFVYGLSLNMMFGVLFALIALGFTLWGVGNLKASGTQHAPVSM